MQADYTSRPTLVQDMLRFQAMCRPQHTAIEAPRGPTFSYAVLAEQAQLMAQSLVAQGIRPGDRIVLWAYSGIRFATAVFAILEAGCTVVPVDPKARKEDLAYIIEDCRPTALAIDDEVGPLPEADIPFFRIDHPAPKTLPTLPPIHLDNKMLALIVYTSGSTSKPLGVACHHEQVVFACTTIRDVLEITSDDTILSGLPMAFDYGLYQLFLSVSSGARLVLLRDFSNPVALPGQLARYKATIFPVVPSLVALLLKTGLFERATLPHLRLVTSTGEVFPTAHANRLRCLLPDTLVTPMYGLTECKRVSIVPLQETTSHPDSVGLPLPGTRVAIVDDAGQMLPPGTIGELVVYGPHLADGYWNNPEATLRCYRPDPITGERALYTGDRFWQDELGYLYFIGRDGSFVKICGHRISTVGIEAKLAEIAGVAEVAVVGVPDPQLGERIVVYLVPTRDRLLTVDMIQKELDAQLPQTLLKPKITIQHGPLPKMWNGKIDRLHLQYLASEGMNRGS